MSKASSAARAGNAPVAQPGAPRRRAGALPDGPGRDRPQRGHRGVQGASARTPTPRTAPVAGADPEHFARVLNGVVKRQREIDPLIDQQLATGWRLVRVDAILRAILRAGGFELMELTDVPARVVISEYIEVAHAFFEGDEPQGRQRRARPAGPQAPARRAAGPELSIADMRRGRRRRQCDGRSSSHETNLCTAKKRSSPCWRRWREGHAGAFGLKDDCALLTPEPGTELVLKTDPVAEGVHFLPGDAPQDIAWKALAVNVSDLAAKGAAPLGYLMALSFPAAPTRGWMAGFAEGLEAAQTAVRLPSDGRRHGSPAGAADHLHHRHRLGAAGQDGAANARRKPAMPCSCPAPSAMPGSAWNCAKNAGLAGGLGAVATPQAEHLRAALSAPRAAAGPGARCCATTPRPPWTSRTASSRTSTACCALRASQDVSSPPTCPCPTAARKVLARAPERLSRLMTAGDDYEILASRARATKPVPSQRQQRRPASP